MDLKNIKILPSTRANKKYMAILRNGDKIHFGGKGYEQFKDSTGLGLYSHMDHGDKKRRENYFSRHSFGIKNKKDALKYEWNKSKRITAKILSHQYLW